MKCKDCSNYIENICVLAQEGKLSEMENPLCFARLQTMLLRDIWEALNEEKIDDADRWKFS